MAAARPTGPEAFGVPVPPGARCLVAGIDVIRDGAGEYRVLEDNLRSPSGVSYVIENRAALTRVLPQLFAGERVRRVDHYGRKLHEALQRASPPGAGDNPTVVVLTPGIYNSAYFEHCFLAQRMGVELVQGSDLVVDGGYVWMRTTKGLERVDVIYRRIDDDFLDPKTFRSDSTLGVAGLLMLNGSYLAPYGDGLGQLVLLVVAASFTGCLLWVRSLTLSAPAPRFLTGPEDVR